MWEYTKDFISGACTKASIAGTAHKAQLMGQEMSILK